MRRVCLCRVALLVVVLIAAGVGCRRHEPPQRLAKNLGTPDDPVLPTTITEYDAAILSGKAAPVRAAEISEEEDADTNGAEEVGEEGPEGQVSDEDRELIQEVMDLGFEAVAKGEFAELASLLAPAQQDTMRPLFEEFGKLAEAGERLFRTVEEKAPGTMASMPMMMPIPGLAPGAGMQPFGEGEPDPEQLAKLIKLTDLRMTADDKAVGDISIEMVGQTLPLEFWLVDDEWFIHLPEVIVDQELVAGLVRVGGVVTAKMEDVASRVEDGSLAPQAFMAEFMMLGPELQPIITELAPKFQELAEHFGATEEVPEESAEADEDAEPGEAAELGEVPDEVREAIEELLAEYDRVEAEKRFDDIAALHVPEQRAPAGEVVNGWSGVLGAIEGFAAALNQAGPGAGSSIEAMLNQSLNAPRTINELGMVSPGRVAGTVTEMNESDSLGFRLIDEAWYVWDPDFADPEIVSEMVEVLASTAEKLEGLTERVGSGDTALQAANVEFMTIVRELSTSMDELEAEAAGADADQDAEPEPAPADRGRGRSRGRM
jgi:hypothetical protein